MKEYIQKVAVTLLVILAFVFVPLFFYSIFPHFTPFIIAFLFALLLEPFNLWMVKKLKISWPIAVNISYFLFFGGVILLTYFLSTKLIREVLELMKYIQRNIPEIQTWFSDVFQQIHEFTLFLPPEMGMQIEQIYTNFMQQLSNLNLLSSLGAYTFNLTAAIPNFFIVMIIFFISLYMMSLDLKKIKSKFFSFFKDTSKPKVEVVLSDLRNATVGFLQAQVILSTITYLVSLSGLLILGVRYAMALALLIVIVDILPILGTGSVLVPWGLFSMALGDIFLGVGLIVLFLLITVLRRIIEPKILGVRIGLNALTTLICIWVGFKAMGIAGVFLFPLLLILYKALIKAKVIQFRVKI
ncbi:sporulation integral membrane protein YtvI [Desulfitobacterium metallireducens]|uniref:Sporulation integral membrane protein YtvI n=1 Tax=Desulfitobacterium metallireducens DSM 15288 TaxID=871968 RepID=W0E6J1_9FIRM|nr:sporulation integral membrane protein YtvI [Desulfitobacterium metallireducens]AHF06505.1 sporulation integral membrane protein YtvI [Desulfitobacterium metallireducens DSM 15288]